ncbi:alpha/beta hydrolase [Hoeflea prorocentri]|uniref:Alpha/beta hydrolase n=1 Tax=Hoeflea prorocentri TaxID=1922333 RepID=A0A9X3ZJU9_9HYPH|nr:alpha/beta hydrolase [Hoeflea prorocentri]MCY6383371.1 alpha/beta hydrolase [Hoeflea prorocentri]MDA5401171.1 alpha/beta hydrolase [Hoeflea prorocentri]
MFEIVEFRSGQALLRGRMYCHSRNHTPCVVMTHGTSATISMVADAYAEAIHFAGFDVLLFDHANFGISGGEPRQEINPWIQARGYRDAVRHLRLQPGCGDIALWGDSYSAMVALVAGSMIPDVRAIVAQIPACGIELPGIEPNKARFLEMQAIFESGDVGGGPEHVQGPLPVVSADQINAPSILAPIQAFRWFLHFGGRYGTGWENRVTRVTPPTAVPFSPYLAAPFVTARVLMMVGRNDEMVHCNPQVQRAVYEKIEAQKEFCEVDGGHFGLLWHPGQIFDKAVARQIDFLKSSLDDG